MGAYSRRASLAWRGVPTIRLDHLTEAQAKAFMIADNRLTENSTWDERLLAEQLRNLSVLDLDFSLEATGFAMGEIDLKIEGLTSPSENEDPADEVPTHAGPTVSELGDLWLLGRHRVYCGSALDQILTRGLWTDELAAAVFTDPPYNVPIAGNVSGLGADSAPRLRDGVWRNERGGVHRFLTCMLLAPRPPQQRRLIAFLYVWIGGI